MCQRYVYLPCKNVWASLPNIDNHIAVLQFCSLLRSPPTSKLKAGLYLSSCAPERGPKICTNNCRKKIYHYYLKIFKKNVTARLAGPKCVVIGSRSVGATVFHPSQQLPKFKHFRHPLVAGPAEPAKSYQTPRRQQYQCHTEKIIEMASLCYNAKFPPYNNKCVRYSGQRKKAVFSG